MDLKHALAVMAFALASGTVPATAQTSTSYALRGDSTSDRGNPFTATFTVLDNNGTYTLTDFNASYRTGLFDLSNSSLLSVNSMRNIIYGNINSTGSLAGTDDFSFQYNPLTNTGISLSFSSTQTRGIASATPVLTITSIPAVPEPAAWTLLIAGFGAVGGTLRRRRRARAATA